MELYYEVLPSQALSPTLHHFLSLLNIGCLFKAPHRRWLQEHLQLLVSMGALHVRYLEILAADGFPSPQCQYPYFSQLCCVWVWYCHSITGSAGHIALVLLLVLQTCPLPGDSPRQYAGLVYLHIILIIGNSGGFQLISLEDGDTLFGCHGIGPLIHNLGMVFGKRPQLLFYKIGAFP